MEKIDKNSLFISGGGQGSVDADHVACILVEGVVLEAVVVGLQGIRFCRSEFKCVRPVNAKAAIDTSGYTPDESDVASARTDGFVLN